MMEKIIKSMPPIENSNSEILILGTMPGEDSIESNEYYKNVDNLFWDVMFRICDKNWPMFKEAYEEQNYEKRCQLLLQNKIALWDIIESCEREGNKDSDIQNIKFNDIEKFLKEHPHIQKILFNGKKAYQYYQDMDIRVPVECINLQSTSPSNQANSFYILVQWKDAILGTHF